MNVKEYQPLFCSCLMQMLGYQLRSTFHHTYSDHFLVVPFWGQNQYKHKAFYRDDNWSIVLTSFDTNFFGHNKIFYYANQERYVRVSVFPAPSRGIKTEFQFLSFPYNRKENYIISPFLFLFIFHHLDMAFKPLRFQIAFKTPFHFLI